MLQAGTSFFRYLTAKLTKGRLGNGNRSPNRVITTVFTEVLSSTSCKVWAKFSTMTMAAAPESLS
jgi:hypothetical protein